MSYHSDGKLYVGVLTEHKVLAIDVNGSTSEILKKTNADFMTITDKAIYFSETARDRIGIYRFSNKLLQYMDVPFHPTGIAVSSEQTFLNVAASNSVLGYSYKILEDGWISFGQPYIHYHIPYGQTTTLPQGMTVDSENLLYTATAMGVQVSDQLGRVNFIFTKPGDEAADVKIGGSEFNLLYTSCNGKIFRRKIKAKGIHSWLSPVKPPQPGL